MFLDPIMDPTHGLFLFSLIQEFVGQPVTKDSYFSLPAEIQALRGSCVVIPCNSSRVFPDSLHTLNFKWCLWRTSTLPEIYNSMDSTGVEPRFKGRTFFVGNLKQNNCSLRINNVTADDADEYYPLIETRYDQTVRVKVSDFPEQPTILQPYKMAEGHSVMIHCSVVHTCPPHPPTLAWDRLQGHTSIYHEDLNDGRWRAVLTLNYTPTEEDHQKSFTCSATHSNEKISNEFTLFLIRYAPKGTTVVIDGNRRVQEGDMVTLKCSSRGYPSEMTYRWFEGLQKVQLQSNEQEAVITLRNISWDSGPYVCTAQNDVGTGGSPPLDLNIEYPPKGAHISSVEDFPGGQQMVLSCETMSSNPAVISYTWYRNGTSIKNQEEKTLKISKTARQESVEYQCMAHNELGSDLSAVVSVNAELLETGVSIVAVLRLTAAGVILILLTFIVWNCIRSQKKQVTGPGQQSPSPPAARCNENSGTHEELVITESLKRTSSDYANVVDRHLATSTK